MPRPVIAIDSETALIQPGLLAPRLICVSYSSDVYGTGLLGREQGIEFYLDALSRAVRGELVLVFQNAPYDLAVAVVAEPRLLDLVFAVYEVGAVRDTKERQKLIDLAEGSLKYLRNPETGEFDKRSYTLEALARRLLGRALDKSGESWRLRYSELDGVPLCDWPEPAKRYAVEDARATFDIYQVQQQMVNFSSVVRWDERLGEAFVVDEIPQLRAGWALHLASCWGLTTDLDRVVKLKNKLLREQVEVRRQLAPTGIFRSYTFQRGEKAGQIQVTKDTKEIRRRVSAGFASRNLDSPTTDSWGKAKLEGKVFDPLKFVQTSEEALRDSGDPDLEVLADSMEGDKILATYIPALERWIVNPSYNLILDTGRCSSYGGQTGLNIQQLPRELEDAPEDTVRACFKARDGFLYAASDFNQVELVALAETCLELFGWSRLAESINAGFDVHLMMAAAHLKMSYEDAVTGRKHDKQGVVAQTRQLMKCFHPDTEVLTKQGWVKINQLNEQTEVAVAVPEHRSVRIEWQIPTTIIRQTYRGSLLHLRNVGIDLRVTPDHRMLGYTKQLKPIVVEPRSLNKCRFFVNGGVCNEGSIQSNEVLLRLAVATQADGSLITGGAIRFGFSKLRKIERLRSLLSSIDKGGRAWKERTKDNVTTFYVRASLGKQILALLEDGKCFPWWWLQLELGLRQIILNESRYWDSHQEKRRFEFSSTVRQNIDVLQALVAISGLKSRAIMKNRSAPRSTICKLSIRDHVFSRGGSIRINSFDYEGEVVCLSVPSTFVLVRDGGVPVITGQCVNFGYPGGMGAMKLVSFAKNQKQTISLDEAKYLKDLFVNQWPEMALYFDWHKKLVGDAGEGTLVQPISGRIRGGVSFTQSCNGLFQSRVADLAKAALWAVCKECYVDRASPLYGSRVVAFIHDEILAEVPEARAAEAAERLKFVMEAEARKYISKVKVEATPALMRYWYKVADTVRDEQGRLLEWKTAA